jgi:hypothetical protein
VYSLYIRLSGYRSANSACSGKGAVSRKSLENKGRIIMAKAAPEGVCYVWTVQT